MRRFEEFILDIPYLFLKKIPYAWLAVVYFWSRPPVLSGILLTIVLVGLGMMALQERAWEAKIRREFCDGKSKPLIDHPHAARTFQLRNLALVLAGSAGVGWLLNGRVNLSGLQWALLLAGTMLLYKDSLLFGAGVSYVITDQGIGIRFVPGHVDYRLFFKFSEIRQAVRTQAPKRVPRSWDVLAAQRHPQEGLLLYANNPNGFSKQMQGEVFFAPTNIDEFQAELSEHVQVSQAAAPTSLV
jgi:hypothetical protein